MRQPPRCMHPWEPLDVQFVERINANLSRTAALEPGVLRTAQNIMVRTALGSYVPPVPNRDELASVIADIQATDGTLTDASRLFAVLAKAQPFGDGNKRTALLAANQLLMIKGCNQVLVVPVDDPDRTEFNTLLGEWYVNGNSDVIRWLADYNNNVDGLDRFGHAVPSED
ncbi:mucin-2 [Bifidobacterium cuniculi]|uniref:Mucin-2 n=1 Tax=Bifidobacterium cuniculi TaxID=1688 RepID=A0A087AX75_9BIFI|nr:mucin-2 [Bifidobacterium cuniculi]